MKKHFLTGLRLFAGATLILLGIIGIFLPILQGWLLIFAGVALVKPEYAHRAKEKFAEWRAALKQRFRTK